MGQGIARDEEVAERAARENATEEGAQAQFDAEAEGEQTHREGYPRPEGEQPDDGPVGSESP
jgi:hypothetical protein